MTRLQRVPWDSPEQWNGPTFLLAGVLMLGIAVYKGLGAFTSVTVPGVVDVGYGGLALLSAVFALLGLYPRLRESAPRLSVAGVLAVIVAAGGILAVEVWLIGATLKTGRFPAIPADAPAWTVAALVAVFFTLALGFLLFWVASLRTTALSRPVSLLLVVPAVMWFSLLGNVFVRAIANLDFYVYLVISVTLLTVGYLLRAGDHATDHVSAVNDSTA